MSDDSVGRRALARIATFLSELTDGDLLALARGEKKLALRQASGQSEGAKKTHRRRVLPDSEMDRIIEHLLSIHSRDEGIAVLAQANLTREGLERLARRADLPVTKHDKTERIQARIVESLVGFRLRSRAIQGDDEDQRRWPESLFEGTTDSGLSMKRTGKRAFAKKAKGQGGTPPP